MDCEKSCKKLTLGERVFGRIGGWFDSPALLLTAFVLVTSALYLPLIFWDTLPGRDVAHRFVPMVDAFVRGDFMYAFHPRCQTLHAAVAGVIALSGCGSYMACKLSSFLFYLLTVVPLFFCCRRVFGGRVAKWVVWGFAFASPLISSLAVIGLRDAAKMFVLVMMSHALIAIRQERHKIGYYIYAGIAAGMAVCVRNDLLAVTLVILFISGLLDRAEHRFVWRSLLGALAAFAVGMVELYTNYAVSGYVIPGARYYYIFTNWLKIQPEWLPVLGMVVLPMFVGGIAGVYIVNKIWSWRVGKWFIALLCAAAAVGLIVRVILLAEADTDMAADFFNAIMSGVSWVFFPLAVIGAGLRIIKKQWTKEETLLAILFGVFELAVIVQIIVYYKYLYVSGRYLLSAVPLLLPWSWCALEQLWEYTARFLHLPWPKKLFGVLVAVFIGLGIYCAYRPELNEHIRPREIRNKEAIMAIGEVIKNEKSSFDAPTFEMMLYKANVRPRVYFDCSGRLSVAVYPGNASQAVRASEMDLLVTSANATERTLKRKFKNVKRFEKRGGVIVFRKEKLQVWKVFRK